MAVYEAQVDADSTLKVIVGCSEGQTLTEGIWLLWYIQRTGSAKSVMVVGSKEGILLNPPALGSYR